MRRPNLARKFNSKYGQVRQDTPCIGFPFACSPGLYPIGRKLLRALGGVSFQLAAGRTLAVIGESGCSKSTLAHLAALMEPTTSGKVLVIGQPADGSTRRTLQLQNQLVFQNPYAALNPRRTTVEAPIEPLTLNRRNTRPARIADRRSRVYGMRC